MTHSLRALLSVPVLFAAVASAQTLQNEKYTLDNGMTVILHVDHSLPRAAVNIWYRVGARNEPPGRSGFAHLFEHLMFMGTKRVPGGNFDTIMETGGGANNASTSLDRTNYYSSGPSSLLPTLLWLDADRLEDMGVMMTQEKLDKQRDVVRNERRQTTEEAPYGRAYEASLKLLYPPTHPYHYGVIGTHEDLEAGTVDDVKNFFATFYQPNNAALVVAGDFDPATIKPLVKDLFGSLPRGNVAPQPIVATPVLDRVVRSTSFDKIQLPAVGFAFHSPGQFQDGDGEMDLAASILGEGQNSRLYQRLVVKEQLAAEIQCSQDSSFLSSVFRVTVLAKPDADLSKVERIMDEELNRFMADGPTQAELDQRKISIELGRVRALQGLESRADAMNQYEYIWGTPDGLERDLNRYRHATTDSVKNWAKKVCTLNARVIQYVLPEEPSRPPTARDARPKDSEGAPFTPMQPETVTLSNGVKAMVFSKPGLPLVNVGILFKPGNGVAIDLPAQAGRSSLMARMLREGTKDMDGAAFASAMQSLGATFSPGADVESFDINISGLKKNMDQALALASEAMRAPRMSEADFTRVKGLMIDELKQAEDEPRAVAPKVASMMLFGENHPYGASTNAEKIAAIDLAAVKNAHTTILHPSSATVVVAGDVTTAEAQTLLEKHFGNAAWKSAPTDVVWPTVAEPKWADGMRLFIVNRPRAVQTMIHLRAPGVKFNDASRVERQLLNTIVGGSFTSRLNQNLRERNGFTYGARTGFNSGPSAGSFTAATSVIASKTGPALKEFFAELRGVRDGTMKITDDEAAKARASTFDNLVEPFGNLGGIVNLAGTFTEAGLPWSAFGTDVNACKKIDATALNSLAAKAVDLDRAVLVLMGDKDLILEQIKDLGLPVPVFVDANGKAK